MSIPSRTAARLSRRSPRHLGGAGQRRREKDDAEIGVGPDRLARRADRFENAPPDRQAGVGERRGRDAGAGEELVGGHAVPIGKEMHIAGLQRLDLAPAGVFIGGPDVLSRKRHVKNLPARRNGRACRRCGFAGTVGQELQQGLGDRIGDAHGGDRLQPRPGRHAVDLEHEQAAVGRRHDVDAGKIRADGGGRGDRQCRQFGFVMPRNLLRHRASVDVGDPVGAAAAHHRHRLAGADEDAKVAEGRTGARHIMLEIVDVVHFFRGRQVDERADQPDAAPLRAEKRLQHQRRQREFAGGDLLGCR